jgi:hypothetical protein
VQVELVGGSSRVLKNINELPVALELATALLPILFVGMIRWRRGFQYRGLLFLLQMAVDKVKGWNDPATTEIGSYALLSSDAK